MTKPIMSEAEWTALFISGKLPRIYVNVWDCKASIMIRGEDEKYVDITSLIPDGERLAREAVEAAGGTITTSGWYPPSEEIMQTIKKLGEDVYLGAKKLGEEIYQLIKKITEN